MGKKVTKTTMALDNPSYFSLSANTDPSSTVPEDPLTYIPVGNRGFAAFFKKKPVKMGLTTSTDSPTATTNLLIHHDSNKSISSVEENQPMLSRSTNGGSGSRKSFRNLFRSVSANTESEKTLQILKGDPRPADVAPPSPYLPHRSHSHSDHDRRNRPTQRRILKSASELLSNDMIFCGLTGDDATNNQVNSRKNNKNVDENNDDDDDDDDTGEVFLGIDDARYYNLSTNHPVSNVRRHSIGTFIDKEQDVIVTKSGGIIQTDGFIKEPETIAPPIPVDQVDGDTKLHTKVNKKCRKYRHTSRKGSRTRSGGGSSGVVTSTKLDGTNASYMEDREDVVFVSSKDSEASALWVNYLTACFEQISRQQGRPPFKVRHVTVEDSTSISSAIHEKISRARLQIIVVCPILLERASSRPEQASSLARQLMPERVLAMMLGVHDGHMTENQKLALISYSQWRKFFVKDQDETFVGEFLGAAVSILGTTPPAALRSDKTTFSIHPKKVKMGQNKVLVILNDPLRVEDTVNVIVDRCGEGVEVNQVKRRNPYTLQLSIPEKCLEVSMLIGVRIIINGIPQGVRQIKCESRMRELDQILRGHDNPLEFICQTFGFNSGDREQLDNWMVNAFQKNVPPRFDLLVTPSGSAPIQKHSISTEEYPTLLHFAARFGLEKLAWQLLECPGGEIACDMKNISESTPADLAEHAGHVKLAHQLRGYMQMNEFTNMYSYLKIISENTSGAGANNENAPPSNLNDHNSEQDKVDYCRPRPLSEAYLVPPAARPVITSAPMPANTPPQLPPPNPTMSSPCDNNYSIVPPPTPILAHVQSTSTNTDENSLNFPLQGYLKMQPAGPKTLSPINAPFTAPLMALKPFQMSQSLRKDVLINREDNVINSNSSHSGSLPRSTSSNGVKSCEPSGPQDELLEIINDFKNNVFTISEVERLVDNWRNRNDVQQSFKDKQRQLSVMRDEYERIQKKMKEEMKAPTPFDRIKKLFTKNKKETKELGNSQDDSDATPINTKTDNKTNGALNDRRPISSLSLHSTSSSSSSGRMSIISGCSGTSLGDSGTHSDTEDRRLRNIREDKVGMMYEIPPTPKPFTGRYSPMRYTQSPRSTHCSESDQRRPHPQASPSADEYYISFPVSGLPIHSFNPDGTAIEPKTPSSPCDHPSYSTSSSIPEEPNYSDISEVMNIPQQITEINQLSVTSLPPVPPTQIPLDYMNITPSNIPISDHAITVEINSTANKLNVDSEVDVPKILNNESTKVAEKSIKVPVDEQTTVEVSGKSQDTYLNSDHVRDTTTVDSDVVDAPRLPDYMNIQPCDKDPRVIETILKKQPAPPVPPRASAKK